jgi:FHA domain
VKRLSEPNVCCRKSIVEDPAGNFCTLCGTPLVKCMAFEECRGLIGENGLCGTCVDPHLVIVPGATMHAPVGGSVALPFELMNPPSGRTLYVTALWSREGTDWRPERLGWERLDANSRTEASVTARELGSAGLHNVEIIFAVATRWRSREERFVFSTNVRLTIADEKEAAGAQIHISSENQMNGNVIQIHEREKRPGEDGRVIQAIDMNLRRLEVDERRLGLRGTGDNRYVPNSAEFHFKGFAAGETPASGIPIVTPDGLLVFGRSQLRSAGGDSDVRLLFGGPDGAIDEDRSTLLSRRHFELYNENDRLKLRVASGKGLCVNGCEHKTDALVDIAHGDRIAPLVGEPEALELVVGFRAELNKIAEVTISRQPPAAGNAP